MKILGTIYPITVRKTIVNEMCRLRNSVYDINVNKFNNPGYPEIPTPGTDPDEEDGSFLAIQINVNPWTWYTQEEEF